MIEIKKTNDPKVFADFGIQDAEGVTLMAASEKNEVFGIGVTLSKNGFAVLDKIIMKEDFSFFEMEFGMGKSLLNMLDLAGFRYVFSDIENERLMKALRFKQNADLPSDVSPDKKYKNFLCLDGYFTLHKCENE